MIWKMKYKVAVSMFGYVLSVVLLTYVLKTTQDREDKLKKL